MPASTSTARRMVFSFGGELMPVGLDGVLAEARGLAWQAAAFDPDGLTLMWMRRRWAASVGRVD